MSRYPPLVTKKEIIYRRSFFDDHNERFDNAIKNPSAIQPTPKESKPARPQSYVVNHSYSSDFELEYQLSKITKKLDRIIEVLNSPSAKRSSEEHPIVDNLRQEQTRNYMDICKRLDNLESVLTGKTLTTSTHDKISELTNKVHNLAQIQEELKAKLIASNISGDDIDELLKVINDTRLDLEKKIENIKQLSDGNYIHLEDKIDGYLRNQQGIQLQVDNLMQLLTHSSRPASANGSRPTSVIDEASNVSRTSSRGSNIKANLVLPTKRSPPPKSPSEVSYTPIQRKAERSASQKSASTVTSSIATRDSSKKVSQSVEAPKKQEKSRDFEVLEKTKSIETMNEIYTAQNLNDAAIELSSSGSYIAPLAINERRSSQPANIYLTKQF